MLNTVAARFQARIDRLRALAHVSYIIWLGSVQHSSIPELVLFHPVIMLEDVYSALHPYDPCSRCVPDTV